MDSINPFKGSWGIYDASLNEPLIRFDPFRSYLTSNNIKIGFLSTISSLRLLRPDEFSPPPSTKDFPPFSDSSSVFINIVQGNLPAIVIQKDTESYQSIFSTSPKSELLTQHKALSIINMFSPQSRTSSGTYPSQGLSLVHFPTTFSSNFSSLTFSDIHHLFLTTKHSHLKVIQEYSSVRPKSPLSISHFFNIGPSTGASISHIHSQSYFSFLSPYSGLHTHAFSESAKQWSEKHQNRCFACCLTQNSNDTLDLFNQPLNFASRVFYENADWVAFLAFAPERDYHIRILPKSHCTHFHLLTDSQLSSLATLFYYCHSVLDYVSETAASMLRLNKDRNILFRQSPLNSDFYPFHLVIDILPFQPIGGAEIMDSFRIVSLIPEQSVVEIKNYLKSLK